MRRLSGRGAARRAMKPIAERNPILVALVGLVILAVIGLVAYNVGNLPVIGNGTTYTADFTESAGLQPGQSVRVAGVTVGHVSGVSLDKGKVKVAFKVKGAWIGNDSTAAIRISTLLGTKYLAIDPSGTAKQDPGQTIPLSRTTSPYDVTQAFQQTGQVFGELNTQALAQSLETLSKDFQGTPPYVHQALTGLAALSETISSQDAQIAQLLAGTRQVTGTFAKENNQWQLLIGDGNLLLGELRARQQAISSLLTGTADLATQLSGLVKEDNAEIGPMLEKLGQVTSVLQANKDNLNRALALLGPYYRLVGNTIGNGRWFDTYLCGLIPSQYGGTQPAKGCMPPKAGGG